MLLPIRNYRWIVGFCLLYSTSWGFAQTNQISFLLVGDLLLVAAEIEEQHGWLVLDTGAPGLVLNRAYFDGNHAGNQEEALVDVHGQYFIPGWKTIKSLRIGRLDINKVDRARVLDLVGMEQLKGEKILGLLGWSVLRDFAWLLDWDRQMLQLYGLNRRGELLCRGPLETPADSADLYFIDHLPFLRASIGTKSVDLGLDTGAEVNVWCRPRQKWVQKHFLAQDTLLLQGFGSKRTKVPYGHLQPFLIGCRDYSETSFIVPNHSSFGLNSTLGPIDGVLGLPFLKSRKVLFNFRSKKVYFWEEKDQPPYSGYCQKERILP